MSLQVQIISDNKPFAAYLSKLLVAAGHLPCALPEGKEALRAVRLAKPDLLIVAVEAAKVHRLAAEQRVQTPKGPRSVPLIVISDAPRLEAELLHVFDYLLHPLDLSRFLDDIATLAQRPAKLGAPPPLTDQQYQAFAEHLLSCTGLHFELRNRSALERGIHKRMSPLRMGANGDYLAYLKRYGESRHELQKLLQFLTVGETYFFRYPPHFEALRERLIKSPPPKDQPLRIWSAGCSTGEEPYSIAITVMEALPDWRERDIRIFGTDINLQSLNKARRGSYGQWSVRTTDRRHLERYFTRSGEEWRIREEVKRMVEFHHLNLHTPETGLPGVALRELDAIFCRNVLIYFSPGPATRTVEYFAGALKNSGQLFLGHAETMFQRSPFLEVHRKEDSFYYVKLDARQTSTLRPPEQRREPLLVPPPLPVGSESPDARLETARHLFDEEKLDAASELLDKLLVEKPEDTSALILKGFILAGKGRLQEALDTCCRVLALNDLLPDAYFLKGLVLDACDRLQEAADEYRKALLLDNDFIMPRYYMGRLHLRLGKALEAAREIRNSIRILARRKDMATIPYSGGLSRANCLEQLNHALTLVA